MNLEPFVASYGVNAARVRNDIASLKQRFPNLVAQGDMTASGGVASQVVKFQGTIPISYRGNTYHIPLCVWLPASYPSEAPSIFVTPTPDMAIKPQHQYVDVGGRCYLPGLSQWRASTSSLLFVISELQGVFAVNPPVFAKPKDPAAVYRAPASGTSSPAFGHGPAFGGSSGLPNLGGGGMAAGHSMSSTPLPGVDIPITVSSNNNNSNNVNNVNAELLEARKRTWDVVTGECRKMGDEITRFMATQNQLEQGSDEIAVALARMKEHSRQLDVAMDWTAKATADAEAWIAEQAKRNAQGADVKPDEIVVPTSAVGGQLLAAVAATKALEDAIYMLNSAVKAGAKLDCETFTKEMRKLCSAQFMHLALIKKLKAGGVK